MQITWNVSGDDSEKRTLNKKGISKGYCILIDISIAQDTMI